MDANKLKVLRDLPYKISPCCGLCVHGVFLDKNWGSCLKHSYQHLKHTGEVRHLSVFQYGSCNSFEFAESLRLTLGAYQEFLP